MKKYKFRCIKNVFMEPSGQQAFVEGKTYVGIKNNYVAENSYSFQNEYNQNFAHQVHGEWLKEHFKPQFFIFGR